MADLIITNTGQELQNAQLRSYTKRILNCGANIRKQMLKVARYLYEIDAKELYKEDGFANTREYAHSVLGIKKAQCYHLIGIGRDYIDAKSYESKLPHGENDYNSTQLIALLPLKSPSLALELAEREVITPEMSIKGIKDVVNQYKPQKEKETHDEEESTSDEPIEANATAIETLHNIRIEREGEEVRIILDDSPVNMPTLLDVLGKYFG